MTDRPLRYTGEFHMETPSYGFLMKVRGANGEKPDLQLNDDRGIFLRVSALKETFGNSPSLLKGLNGRTLCFSIRPSGTYQGKIEACDVSDSSPRVPM